jgi:hypothetical protein
MKPKNSSPDDRQFDQLLHEWKVGSTLPPRFDEQVWRRIAAEETPASNPANLLGNWITRLVTRTSFAFSYATILLLAGLLAGLWQARETSHRTSETLSARYVQMIDPYQTPRR